MSQNTPPVRKISVSLPDEVVRYLDEISHLAGVSRSAFLSAVLVRSLPAVRNSAFDAFQASAVDLDSIGADEVKKRYRSASKAIVDEYLASLDGELQHDLFKEAK